MNSSLRTADRFTHIRIVSVALMAAIAVVTVAVNARATDRDATSAQVAAVAPIVKAKVRTSFSVSEIPTIR
jgi:hypothetical protein